MMVLTGPFYQYQGEQLRAPEVVVIRDHHYHENTRCFPLEQLLKNSECDPGLHAVVFDHVLRHDDILQDYNLIFFPSLLARETGEFVAQHIQPNWDHKQATFNFMINKPRPHRILLLKLIEEFGLSNYCHSLAWPDNPVNGVAVTDYRFGNEVQMPRGIRNGDVLNAKTYQGLLQPSVFEPACVALITEPAFVERETIVTEKTIMSMYGGNIPIWAGGWRIADCLRDWEFDTFDDVVDHSYQSLADPADRCRQAVERNLHLLKDFDAVHAVWKTCRYRLEKNLELIKTNPFRLQCLNQIESSSGEIKRAMCKLLGVTKNSPAM
jgi:hypothetical protein